MNKIPIVLGLLSVVAANSFAGEIDCSEAYKSGTTARCEQIKCDEKYESFLGTWSGTMHSLIDFGPNPQYSKYENKITYSPADCLRNMAKGETFIIGRQTDTFPASQGLEARVSPKLLITGKDKNGKPFLRTKDLTTGEYERFQLIHKNEVAVLSIWRIYGVKNGQPYIVETIDAQDWTVENPSRVHKRNVTVTLKSGGFTRLLIFGNHTKQLN